MRKLIITYCLFVFVMGFSQQESMYNHYMFNTQLFNAGYVGASQAHTFNLLQRKQWAGFDGAPVSQSFSYGTPVNQKRLAYGLSAINDKIGPMRNNSFAADIAYHLLLNDNNKVLSVGLKLSLNSFNFNSDELNLDQIEDPLFLSESIGNKPNIGTGIYYYTDKFYAGLSVPYFIENKELGQKRHIYFTSGLLVNLFRDVQLRPSTLIKMTKGAPVTHDLSALLIFNDRFWFGANIRSTFKDVFPKADTGGGFGGILGINVTDNIMISYAYSYSFGNRTGVFNNGSHEIFLRYNLQKAINALIDSPRYF